MFTGIIEEVGTIKAISQSADNYELTISAKKVLNEIKIGDSIAINGICLTVKKFTSTEFSLDVMPITLEKSSLAHTMVNSRVNLERAVRPQDRLGGHIVTGHIDGTGIIREIKPQGNAYFLQIEASNHRYLVKEGSVCLEGISLTVAELNEPLLWVSIVPHTWENTNLRYKNRGDTVNLESDILAKYTEKLLKFDNSKIDSNFLQNNGFI
ncbi:MAG: riboflavin synthase [Candidatus Cloacimonadota bacterium]|nr:riboflavin synthase [Candidatus Cloacimonadota bacterium]